VASQVPEKETTTPWSLLVEKVRRWRVGRDTVVAVLVNFFEMRMVFPLYLYTLLVELADCIPFHNDFISGVLSTDTCSGAFGDRQSPAYYNQPTGQAIAEMKRS
jgi:hypothetical protein